MAKVDEPGSWKLKRILRHIFELEETRGRIEAGHADCPECGRDRLGRLHFAKSKGHECDLCARDCRKRRLRFYRCNCGLIIDEQCVRKKATLLRLYRLLSKAYRQISPGETEDQEAAKLTAHDYREAAMDCLELAEKMSLRLHPWDRAGKAVIEHELGQLYREMGEFRLAKQKLTRAQKRMQRLRGRAELAVIFLDKGLVYQDEKKWEAAGRQIRKSLHIVQSVKKDRSVLDADRRNLATCPLRGESAALYSLAQVELHANNLEKAWELLDKALAIEKELEAEQSHKEGLKRKTRDRKPLGVKRALHGYADHPGVALVLQQQAEVLLQTGAVFEAFQKAKESRTAIRKLYLSELLHSSPTALKSRGPARPVQTAPVFKARLPS